MNTQQLANMTHRDFGGRTPSDDARLCRQLSFAIHGMFCARCARDLERALAQVDGVVAAHVAITGSDCNAAERATVVYDPMRTHAAALVQAIRRAGFETPLDRSTLQVNEVALVVVERVRAAPFFEARG